MVGTCRHNSTPVDEEGRVLNPSRDNNARHVPYVGGKGGEKPTYYKYVNADLIYEY